MFSILISAELIDLCLPQDTDLKGADLSDFLAQGGDKVYLKWSTFVTVTFSDLFISENQFLMQKLSAFAVF